MHPSVIMVFFLSLYAFISYWHRLLLFEFNSTGHNIRIFKYDFVKTLQHKVAYKIMMNVELRRREVINKPLLLLLLLLLLLHTVKIDPRDWINFKIICRQKTTKYFYEAFSSSLILLSLFDKKIWFVYRVFLSAEEIYVFDNISLSFKCLLSWVLVLHNSIAQDINTHKLINT